MDKKIAKIGMIMVLTLALIISSLGVFNFGDNLAKEFNIDATNEITAEAASSLVLKGGGTASDPFLISTAADLQYFADRVNAGDTNYKSAHYRMTDNIVVTRNPWIPISNAGYNFYGTFDGGGHTVSGIRTNNGLQAVGLFGMVAKNATVKNVGVINSDINGVGGVGGVVGYNYGDVINCYNTGSISGTTFFGNGGVVGSNYGKVINCYNTGRVSGLEPGGVVGENNYNAGTVTNCYYLNSAAPKAIGINDNTATGCAKFDTAGNLTLEGNGSIIGGNNLLFPALNAGKDSYNNANPAAAPAVKWVDVPGGYPTFIGSVKIDETQLKVTYDGNSHPFEVKPIPNSLTGFIVTYQKNGTGGFTAEVPKDVGSYDVKVTRAEDATYAAFETTITGGVAITPKPLTVTPKTDTAATVTKVYDGNTTFTGAITSGTHYTLDKVGSEDVSLTIDTKTFDSKIVSDSKTVAITYTAVLTGAASANYSVVAGTFNIKGTITKKPLTVTAATGGAAWEKVYDGKVGYTGAVNNTHYTLDTINTDVVLLTLGDKNFDSKDVLTATKVTVNYSTVLTGADSANYSVVAGTFDHPAKITPKPLTEIKVEKKGDGNANFIVQLSTTNCKGFVDGDTVNVNFATSAATEGIYNGNAGGIQGAVTLTGANAGNYSVAKEQVIATITKNTLPAITGITNTIYSGLEQPVTPVLAGTTTADYTLSWEYAVNGTDFAVETAPKFKNAGTYRVTATGKGNYVGSTSVEDYVIAPKVVTLTWTDPPTALVYDGNAKIPGVTVEGLISPDTFGVAVDLTNGSNINVGTFTYTAKATAPLNTNYALPAAVTKDYAITKAPNAWVNMPPLSIEDIKQGEALNPIAKSLFGAAKFTYYADNNGIIGAEIAVPTEIGTYWVKAHVADDTNYDGILDTGTEVSFKISKKADGGGGPVSSITQNDVFWTGVIIDLKNKDDTVLKRECDYGTMPKNVLETIQDTNKTLDITMMGEKLYITSEKIKGLTFDKDEYTIEEIKAMLADKPVITPTPTPDPVEPTPEKPANLLWLWILLIIIAISIIIAFIIVGKKKKKQDDENNNNNIK